MKILSSIVFIVLIFLPTSFVYGGESSFGIYGKIPITRNWFKKIKVDLKGKSGGVRTSFPVVKNSELTSRKEFLSRFFLNEEDYKKAQEIVESFQPDKDIGVIELKP